MRLSQKPYGILVLLLCLNVTIDTLHAQTLIGNQVEIQLPVDQYGTKTNALVYLPSDYNTNTNDYALIFFLHGIGQAGTNINTLITDGLPQQIAQGFQPQAINPKDGKLYKFIVVSPQSPTWSYGYTNIQYMLPAALKMFRVDTTRLYLTGLSAGGWGSWTCVTDDSNFSKKFAAMAVMSSAPLEPFRVPYVVTAAKNHLPIWDICGMADGFYWNNLAYIDTIDKKNPSPIPDTTWLYNVGHSSWHQGYDPNWTGRTGNSKGLNVYQWFLTWTRGTAVAPAVVTVPPTAKVASTSISMTLPTNSALLNGSASTAPVGTTLTTYSWIVLSGPAGYDLTNATTSEATLSKVVAGIYKITFQVTDNAGIASAKDTVTVTVVNPPVVVPPTANVASSSITLTLPISTTILNGSGSAAPSGATLTAYDWSVISGPAGYSLTNATTAEATLSKLIAGTYKISFQVTDNAGIVSSKDTVTVTVVNPPTPPVARVSSAAILLTLPTSSTVLNGSGSTAPSGATLMVYNWIVVSGPSGYSITNASTSEATLSKLVAGTYKISFQVTDNVGIVSAKDTVVVTVVSAPAAPVARVASASISMTLPATSTLLNGSGSTTATGTTLTSFNWTFMSGPAGYLLSNAMTSEATFSKLVAGIYKVSFQVTDNLGVVSNKDTVTVTVTNPPPPTAKVASASISITLPVSTTLLNGSGSSAPAGITLTGYNWTFLSGPSGYALTDATTAEATLSKLVAGTYKLSFQVTDNMGMASKKDTVVVTVLSAPVVTVPTPPSSKSASTSSSSVAAATPSAKITPGSMVMVLPANYIDLNGASSTTPVGTSISSYKWSLVSGPTAYSMGSTTGSVLPLWNLGAGNFRFSLTVTNNKGLSARDTVSVTVLSTVPTTASGAAPAPIVKVTPVNPSLTMPVNYTNLDGIATAPTGATIIAYQWNFLSGPSQYAMSLPSTPSVSLWNMEAGTYTFVLTAFDSKGGMAKDTVSVFVHASPTVTATIPPAKPVAKASPATVTLIAPYNFVNLYATGSTAPAGASISSYKWAFVSGPSHYSMGLSNGTDLPLWNLTPGTFRFSLTITDSKGQSATDTATVIYLTAPLATTDDVASAIPQLSDNPASIISNTDTVITLSDVAGYILNGGQSYVASSKNPATYDWRQSAGPVDVQLTSASASTTGISNLTQPGAYAFQLTVIDASGAKSTSTMVLEVLATDHHPVKIYPNPAQDNLHVFLNADLEGTILLRIYDEHGTLLQTEEVQKTGKEPQLQTLHVSKLNAGMYFLRVDCKKETSATPFMKVN